MYYNDYYKPYQIQSDIYHIHEPLEVYSTLIVGKEKAMLIDTGHGFGDLKAVVRRITDLPLIVINTHGHMDHCGGNYMFDEVHINYQDMPIYYWHQETQKKLGLDFQKWKADTAKREYPWPEDFDEEAYLETRTKKFIPLENHQVFDLGGHHMEIIFMPGHTKGHVVIFDRDTGLLFSGDNVSFSIWMFLKNSVPLYGYAANLLALTHFPIKGILPAHTRQVFPPELMMLILEAISHVSEDTSKIMKHPRTGQLALLHKEKVTTIPKVPYIYLAYDKDRLYSE